jgi:lysophospholipid acyltransferase (LPLAT)-like uncharacterized protein
MKNLIFAPTGSPSLLRRASEPLWLTTNGAVFLAMVLAHRGIKMGAGDDAELFARPLTQTIYIAWHRYNYLLVHLMKRWPAERRPTLIMHDGIASRALTHESSVWMGFTTFVYSRRSSTSPRQQIIDYMKQSGASILLLPDAGGPYGVVKPGVVELSAATGASVTPVGVRSEGTLKFGKTLQHELPWSGSTLESEVGPTLAPEEVNQARCQQELEALSARP